MKILWTSEIDCGPLSRTTANPDRPGGVDKAQIVSVRSFMRLIRDSRFEIQKK
jgi:hypothetical protein